jgi:hypothetical protein
MEAKKMNIAKRLEILEKHHTINQESKYELEQTVDLDNEDQPFSTYVKIEPDGTRETIDASEAQRLMAHNGKISVSIVD